MSRRAWVVLGVVAGVLLLATGVIAGMLIAEDNGPQRVQTIRGEGTLTSSTVVGDAKGWLGLNVASNISGPRVTAIEPGGPSDKAGLQVNDIIRSVNGVIVRNPSDLRDAIESRKAGELVALTIERTNSEVRTDVTLEAAPVNAQLESPPAAAPAQGAQLAPSTPPSSSAPFIFPVLTNQMRSGLVIEPITEELKQKYGLQRDEGFVVSKVAPQSHGLRAGFQEGDILLAIGGMAVPATDAPDAEATIDRLFDALPVGRSINFRILRGNRETAVPLALPVRQDIPLLEGAPPNLRLLLESMIDTGALSYEQAKTLLSSGQSQSVRIGRVKDVDSSRLTLSVNIRNDDVAIDVTPDTRFQRALTPVSPSDLHNGEVVMVMSIDGGKTAVAVFSYGA